MERGFPESRFSASSERSLHQVPFSAADLTRVPQLMFTDRRFCRAGEADGFLALHVVLVAQGLSPGFLSEDSGIVEPHRSLGPGEWDLVPVTATCVNPLS